jgi:hypothetical protein
MVAMRPVTEQPDLSQRAKLDHLDSGLSQVLDETRGKEKRPDEVEQESYRHPLAGLVT